MDWINRKQGLPIIRQGLTSNIILVYLKNGEIRFVVYHICGRFMKSSMNVVFGGGEYFDSQVTHWMQLESPKSKP